MKLLTIDSVHVFLVVDALAMIIFGNERATSFPHRGSYL